MLSFNLSDINKVKNLVDICEQYKNDFDIDIIHGRQIVDGSSFLGAVSFIGNIVSIRTSEKEGNKYEEFKKKIEEVNQW